MNLHPAAAKSLQWQHLQMDYARRRATAQYDYRRLLLADQYQSSACAQAIEPLVVHHACKAHCDDMRKNIILHFHCCGHSQRGVATVTQGTENSDCHCCVGNLVRAKQAWQWQFKLHRKGATCTIVEISIRCMGLPCLVTYEHRALKFHRACTYYTHSCRILIGHDRRDASSQDSSFLSCEPFGQKCPGKKG